MRKILNLNAGEIIAFEIDRDVIKLRKAKPIDIEFINSIAFPLNFFYGDQVLGKISGEMTTVQSRSDDINQ